MPEDKNATIEQLTNLMVRSFIADPGIQAQLAGLQNGRAVFTSQCKGEIEAFSRAGLLTTAGEDDGLLIAFTLKQATEPQFAEYMQEGTKQILQEVSASDITALQKNAEGVLAITKTDWYLPFTNDRNVCILQVIVVKPELRGTGVFRKLLTPLLKTCDREQLPVVLQTHVKDNIPKYEHFGFRIMETSTSDALHLTCWNMLREPEKRVS